MAVHGEGRALGKAILAGEHAVVYGHPAVSLPVPSLQVRALLRETGRPGFELTAPALGLDGPLPEGPGPAEPFQRLISLAATNLGVHPDGLCLSIESGLPLGRGLGSGAAVSAAVLRAFADLDGQDLDPSVLEALVQDVEKIHHGKPSGIDAATVVRERPILFEDDFQPLVPASFTFLLADSGPALSTRSMVHRVARKREKNPSRTDALLKIMAGLAREAARLLEKGGNGPLGEVMNRNHRALADLGVSTPGLNDLAAAAKGAGATGAKLTGAGGGGFLLVLVDPDRLDPVRQALLQTGAQQVYALIT